MTNTLFAADQHTDHQNSLYTSLHDPEIANILAHINEEHLEELIGFLGAFTSLSVADLDNLNVQLTAIYSEGITLQVQSKNPEYLSADSPYKTTQEQTFFIAFASPIAQLTELQDQYILLKQRADKKLGKKTIKLTKQIFGVQNHYKVSKNMLRLELTMPTLNNSGDASKSISIPTNEAGYAYLFDLEHNLATTNNVDGRIKESLTPSRPHCYYTLRKAWPTPDGIQAWVDVFLHGNTSGGNWAASLQAGDTVITKREFPEKVEHLREGQALLIADETSMPTVARLLELWDNPKPPLVICVTQDTADQKYFDDVKMRRSVESHITDSIENNTDHPFTVLPIDANQINLGQQLATAIDQKLGDYLTHHSLQIDKVWGALEANTAKALRPLLRDRLELNRTEVVVKVYWRQD
ncbi:MULTISPECIES: siderophore-interacting protein [unclassified Psychrobacter]|uniref:siderophore-interacting protein n=1 Tax=unclassified Psychrobacter TaxID=196806 RepID=UPI0025B2969A|nr:MULTISPECIES: siderophore-interacting protein [unclassified Psychrobacter]MDN3451905.1 SIP domain-containing protein [Psychrobacter sp. APC 3350]MDN3501871.1 SIP domain-containing protein [Psychrobacter sp. 5A.1]